MIGALLFAQDLNPRPVLPSPALPLPETVFSAARIRTRILVEPFLIHLSFSFHGFNKLLILSAHILISERGDAKGT
jgi:hypothetical protein